MHRRNLLVGEIVDKVGKENAKGDIQLEQNIQCSSHSWRCDLWKENWHGLSSSNQIQATNM